MKRGTPVVFRKAKNPYTNGWEVIAFFTDTIHNAWPETDQYQFIDCYQHVGQHGTATLDFYYDTVKATPEEYMPLYDELKYLVGYTDLKIRQRLSRR